jgi:hypothetical protein
VTTFPVAVVGIIEAPLPGSGTISYRIGPSGPFTTQSMTSLGLNTYQAALPAALCGERVEFYVSADAAGGETVSDPVTAPADVYEALAAHSLDTLAAYDFETNPGWAVTDSGGLTDGTWDRGVPAGGGDRGDPPTDYDGSGQCWLTDNVDGNSDVDGGTTTLTTQNFDLSAAEDPYVTYARWYSNTFGDAPMADIFEVEISNNGGSSWQDLETIGPTGPEVDGGWFVVNYRIADFITPTAQTRLRFKASDLGSPSVVEAGVDAFSIYDIVCEPCTEPCDDGNPCTLNDACVATTCVGTPVNCSAFSTQCALASCNPAGSSGNCSLLIPMANGTPCDDDDNCNNGEACQGGTCAGGSSPDCSAESDECNTASCDPAGGEGNCDLLSPDNEGQLCSAGTGMCVLGACLDLCAQAADCADLDQDGVRDDGCVWWACVGGACHPQAIGFADMGGSFGTCPPDGTADSSDRFHALNCFADTDTAGNAQAYPCEAAPPAAFNVDAGGQFGDCSPDGVCDGNDAFHALNAFAGATSCSCPADGPVPASPEHKAPTSTGRAELVLRAPRAVLGPNESLEVSVYLGSDLADLRGYQLHLGVSGGTSGSLQLIDVAVQARPDAAFDQLGAWQAFNVATAQMVAGLDSPGVKAPAGSYLATFTYRASPDAAGPFVIEVLHDAGNPAHRTFLFPTPAAAGIEISASNALVIPVDSAGSITRR